MSNEYINNVFDGLKQIREIKDEMLNLSQSFSLTGNDVVSQRLINWCNSLEFSTDRIQKAISKEVNRRPGNVKEPDFNVDPPEIEYVNDIIGMGD